MQRKNRRILTITFLTIAMLLAVFEGTTWSKSFSPNVHWTFCIDTSGSMKSKGHMDLLNLVTTKISQEFLDAKKGIIKQGDRISIFSFDDRSRLEATALYQTQNDLTTIKKKLKDMNKRRGSLTFISEAVVKAVQFTETYDQFFKTNALYVFTDGKSEPYSDKWPKAKIEKRKKKDAENFAKISLFKKDRELNVWLGVLKWEAFADAESLVKRMGKAGHLVNLTDFNRLPLEKALANFADSVRSTVNLPQLASIDFGTIPHKVTGPYQRSISFGIKTEKADEPPSIMGLVDFDPDNPSEIAKKHLVEIKASNDKMVLTFELAESNELAPGNYTGKLELLPSPSQFGTLDIQPSQYNVKFKKSGYLTFYFLRGFLPIAAMFVMVSFVFIKIKKRMPIKV